MCLRHATPWKARVGAPAKALKSPGPLTKAVSAPWATKGRKTKSEKRKAKSRSLGPPTPSRAKPARAGDPGCGPRDDNGGEPTLKNALRRPRASRVGHPQKRKADPSGKRRPRDDSSKQTRARGARDDSARWRGVRFWLRVARGGREQPAHRWHQSRASSAPVEATRRSS